MTALTSHSYPRLLTSSVPSCSSATPQSRMSKKISQLARVIHHLNDRTGDDASSPTGPAGDRPGDLTDLVTVADRYDTEMEQILADAAANSLRDDSRSFLADSSVSRANRSLASASALSASSSSRSR